MLLLSFVCFVCEQMVLWVLFYAKYARLLYIAIYAHSTLRCMWFIYAMAGIGNLACVCLCVFMFYSIFFLRAGYPQFFVVALYIFQLISRLGTFALLIIYSCFHICYSMFAFFHALSCPPVVVWRRCFRLIFVCRTIFVFFLCNESWELSGFARKSTLAP